MHYLNADGTLAQMCGNGIRCMAKYLVDHGFVDDGQPFVDIETRAGVRRVSIMRDDMGRFESATVDMGTPEFEPAKIPVDASGSAFIDQPVEVGGNVWNVTALSVGNPHAVVFVDDVDWLDLPNLGPLFENHPLFPERVNTEFVQVVDRNTLKMRVWERGSGETMACGTGSTAALAAAVVNGRCENSARLILRGGELLIEWDRDKNLIYMTGPAVTVYDGELKI